MSNSIPVLGLKKDMDRRLRGGHPWIFSNEVAALPQGLEAGDLVQVQDHRGTPLGTGYWSRGSLIALRVLERGADLPEGVAWFHGLLAKALARRGHLGRATCRVVFAESDDLPGLIVDRYGEASRAVVVVQCLTQGMERRRTDIAEALDRLLGPRALIFDGSSSFRELEGLPRHREWWSRQDGGGWARRDVGGLGPEAFQEVELDGLRMELDFSSVQKGGLFLDQVENWSRAAGLAKGGAVLDLCCYHGGWGLMALRAGASHADFVDRSESALDRVERNLKVNGLDAMPGERLCAPVLDCVKTLLRRPLRYRLVVADPPAFVKSRKHFAQGRQGYIDLNRQAMALVEDGAFLVSCSCSHHMGVDAFREVLRLAAARAGCRLRILAQLGQGQDHPQLPQVLETSYLKGFVMQVEHRRHESEVQRG
jgi:23S rRNA (cytosine1962-C5)-methyltransferase